MKGPLHACSSWCCAEVCACRRLCCRYIESLIDAEIASGVKSDRIVVAGFSQGGAVAMLMLRSKHKLGGIVGERLA